MPTLVDRGTNPPSITWQVHLVLFSLFFGLPCIEALVCVGPGATGAAPPLHHEMIIDPIVLLNGIAFW